MSLSTKSSGCTSPALYSSLELRETALAGAWTRYFQISLYQDGAAAKEGSDSVWTAPTNSSGVSETEAAGIASPRKWDGESAEGKSG